MIFRRWRHLLVFMGSVLFLEQVGTLIYIELSRPRPYGVPIIGSWAGYAGGSPPVAVLTIFLMGIVYCLAAPGRARSCTKAAVAAVVAVFGFARLYLGVDHPGDVLLGAAFAAAIAVTAFRYFTPNEVFPVVYRRGRAAHVDVTDRRGAAIRQAVRDQLGLRLVEIKPVGLASSAGSTPLRLRVEDGPEQFVFAKLYTRGHVRADRWYKLWRTSRKVHLWLDSDRAGPQAITVTLTATCDTSGAHQIPSDQPGTRRFEHTLSLIPRFSGLRFYTFPGGCATYRFSFAPGASPILADAAGSALSFQPRSVLIESIQRTECLTLCGRGAACPDEPGDGTASAEQLDDP
jgi:hypothetical protein